MAQVVQAKCPHCQNVLRIPADWLAKAMRCKHCKNTFQARDKNAAANSTSVAAGVPAAVGKPKPATAVSAAPPKVAANAPFGLAGDAPTPTVAKPRPSSPAALLILVVMFFFLFLLGVGAVGVVGWKVASNWGEFTAAKPPEKGTLTKSDPPKGTTKGNGNQDGNPANDANKSKDGNNPNKDGSNPSKDGSNPSKDGSNPNKDRVTPPNNDSKKITQPVTDGSKDQKPKKPVFTKDPFPRRALLVSVNNYLMFSTVHYGSPREQGKGAYPGSSTGVLRDLLQRPPMLISPPQITELSDGIEPGGKVSQPHSTQKSVIEATIKDFVETSRAQDRIILVFAGHATVVEEKSYLVPIDGNLKDVESLVPLKWVYDQLASCKAQQKLLILDTFRYSPSRGNELPSAGEGAEGTMPEAFDKDLQNPPAGVQVWCSCVKEQVSLELDRGSAFMQALCNALQADPEMTGFSGQSQPIPIENLVPKVNQRLVELAKAEKKEQISRLTGKQGDTVVAFNGSEPMPASLTLKPPTAGSGGDVAGAAQVNNILDEIKLLPPFRGTRAGDLNLLKAQNLPAFGSKKLEAYKRDDYQDISELQKKYKANKDEFAKQFPLRAAYFDALDALQASNKLSLREVLGSPIDPKRKAAFLLEQQPLGVSIFELDRTLESLKKAGEQREMETSKRWQANFDFAQARLQSRLIYLFEYNYTLGQIRADNLPELAPGQSGWRVGITGAKVNVTEKRAKDLAKANKSLWTKIQNEYPGTPWALLAQREDVIALGLAWRPKSD